MNRPDTQEIYRDFAPLGRWLEAADPLAAPQLMAEDVAKRDRLTLLHEVAGLPIPAYHRFKGSDVFAVARIYDGVGPDEDGQLFAAAFIPRKPDEPILRHRGLTLDDCISWGQANRPKGSYEFLIEPSYEDNAWSTIFVVSEEGIYGEIIPGQHFQLTQGTHVGRPPVQFLFKDNELYTSESGQKTRRAIRSFLEDITIDDPLKRRELQRSLGCTFTASGQLVGYFEAVIDRRYGKAFIDYNRLLGSYFPVPESLRQPEKPRNLLVLTGVVTVEGVANGYLRAADQLDGLTGEFILTAPVTTAADVPVMHEASGIVTEQGGVTSHAAIVARMLGKPCLVGVGGVMVHLGRRAELQATEGQIHIL